MPGLVARATAAPEDHRGPFECCWSSWYLLMIQIKIQSSNDLITWIEHLKLPGKGSALDPLKQPSDDDQLETGATYRVKITVINEAIQSSVRVC